MNDGMLSQDEIDALLKGTISPTDIEENEGSQIEEEHELSLMEKDILGEIGNISFGSSATALSALLNHKVEITTPSVSIVMKSKLADEFPHPYVAVQVSYTQGFSGVNLLVFEQKDAAVIADLMLGGDGKVSTEELGEMELSAVQEAMNQMMGSAATSMSTIFNKRVDISPPTIDVLDIRQGEGTDKIPDDDVLVKISFQLKIGDIIDSHIMQLLPIHFAKSLANEMLNPIGEDNLLTSTSTMETAQEDTAAARIRPQTRVEREQAKTKTEPAVESRLKSHISVEMSHQADSNQMEYQSSTASQQSGSALGKGRPEPVIQPAVFSNFESYPLQESEARNLGMLLDIPLQVTVELGRTKKTVKEILSFTQGSIIELDKLAGEPVDIYVNSRLVAKGEVVVIDENFGVRVTDIISKTDRIHQLK